MHIENDHDNFYTEGSVVRLKAEPGVSLLIMKYQQRVYFCTPVKEPLGKSMPYFAHELAGPVTANGSNQESK